MAKQLNVDMRFTADTSKAKQQINELQQAIQKLGYGAAPKDIINPAQFEQASAAARELAYHLNNAYNTKTGNLDLSRLNASLKASGTDLGKLTANFKNAGEVGQQAFVSLARSIAMADQPTISVNTHLATMFTTLKNVARFQISSSIMHGLIGGIQTAYGYAQDLNESLNNIRIVTGQSSEQMARFAQEANKTARSLSATTLDYTNASLIYYQQGLNDDEVRQRTDVTIKMANVARESAETVSEQLTAIWNNFDDGSKSLEYYADVITALGAATASSSSEISAGLNKFAAVADTVGLSYENATAALATITATTRQSADTVGTGLRTLFSRLQGLSLGETLEDGVNLNKYSEALAKVGVQALDSSGNLRRMDEVLEDLGARWDTLTKAQQTALAQTVGGVRQYTTLVALMDNWDFMKQNQQVAAGAEGTLQEQADIYAESWEAARKRVKAAIESLYDTLIDDKFFIGINNGIEHILIGINNFINNFGGIKNLLISTLSIVFTMIANKISPAIQKVVQDIQIMTGGASKVYAKMQGDFNTAVNSEIASGKYTVSGEAELKSSQQLLLAKTKLGAVNDQLSASEKMRAELAIQGFQQQAKEIKRLADEQIKADEKVTQSKEKVTQAEEKAKAKAKNENDKANTKLTDANIRATTAKTQFEEDYGVSANDKMFILGDKYIKQYSNVENFDEIKKSFQQIEDAAYESGIKIKDKLMDGFENSIRTGAGIDISTEMTQLFSADELMLPPDAADSLDQYKQKIEVLGASLGNVQEYAPNVADALRQISRAETPEEYNKALENLRSECAAVEIPASKVENALKNLGGNSKGIDNYTKALQNLKKAEEEAAKAQQHLTDVTNNSAATDEDVAQAKQELAEAEEKAKQAADDLTEAQNKQNAAVANFNPQHMVTGLEAMTTLAGGLGSLAMGINAVKSAFDAWSNADMSFGEKLTSSLMAISMVVPSVITIMKAFGTISAFTSQSLMTVNGALLANTIGLQSNAAALASAQAVRALMNAGLTAEQANQAALILSTATLTTVEGQEAAVKALQNAEISENTAKLLVNGAAGKTHALTQGLIALLTGKLTAAQWANTFAIEANTAAWYANPITAIIAIALAAVAATILLVTKHIQNQNKAIKENADQTIEATQATLDQAAANRELVNSFDSALAAYEAAKAAGEDLTETQTALANAANNVANAYHIEGAALAELTGNYDDFAKKVENARNQEVTDTVNAANRGKEAVSTKMLLTAREGIGHIYNQTDDYGNQIGTGYKAHFGDGFAGGADDRAIANIVKSGDFKFLSKQAGDNSINLNMSKFDASNIIAAYDEVGKVLEKARETMTDEELTKSETYQKMRDWYNKMSESAEQYKQYEQTIADLNIENKDRSGAMGIKSSDVKTLEDYQSLRSKLIASLKEEKGIVDENSEEFKEITASVDAYLGSLESLSKFKLQNDAIADFNKISGGDIQQWAESHNLDIEVALQINPYLPEELWDEQIAVIQAKADREKILLKIETIQYGKDLAGDSKTTSSDWVDWKENFSPEDWNNFLETSGFSDFSEFLVLSDEDKTKILNSYQDVLEQQAEAAREETEERKAANEAWLTGGSYEGGSFVTNEAKYQKAKSSNEYLESQMAAWNKKKSGNETLTDSETASIEGWDEAMAQHVATQIEANNQIIQSYEGVQAAIDADSAALQRMADEDVAQSTIGWLDEFKAGLEGTDFKYDDIAEYAQYLQEIGVFAKEGYENIADFQRESLEFALAMKKLDKGIKSLKDSGQNWLNILEDMPKASDEANQAVDGLAEALEDITGIDKDVFNYDWLTNVDNKKLVKDVIDGVEGAVQALQAKLGSDKIGALEYPITAKVDKDTFNTDMQDLSSLYNDFIQNEFPDLEVGASIDDTAFYQQLVDMVNQAEMSIDDMNNILSGIGMEVETEEVALPEKTDVSQFQAGQVITVDGKEYTFTGTTGMNAAGQTTVTVLKGTKYKGSGGGGGGSKGGGGGGSNKKTHEQKKRDGGDRYRPIKAKQEDKSRQIDQAREKAERLAGKARIDNLKEENKLLGDNIKLQQQYIDEINNYLAQDKSDMLSKFGDFGISLNFDENGVINNYDSIMDRMYAIYNEKANQELDEDTWKEFEEEWQAAIDALEQYVETRDLAEEETANLADMINEQFDQLLEMAATKLELDIQVNDQDLEFLDYLLNKIDDDAYKAAEAIALMGDKAARELERANYYQNAINQTLATYGIDSMEQLANMSPEELQNLGITQDTIDNLIDWNNELLSTAETLDELQSEIIDKVISGFDDLNEKVQDSYDYFSHWNTVLENYRDIVDLNMSALGGKQARDLIKTIDNSMLKNSVNALRSSKQIYDDLVKGRAEAEAKLQEAVAAGRIGDIQRYEDVLADIDEKIKDSQEQWLSDWSDGLQKAQDILTRAVEDAVAEYDKLLSPVYGSLDYLSEAYDRGKEVDEDYVQDYEKLYQLNKLNRDLTKVLGDTDGLKNKEQLIKLQEKINKLQKDNTKMSEYDLEVLRKEFEVQQARIALEEAANAKSTVRLQRDNEGNWGYVYTSDFDSTEELQQSYEDKLHEYQQLNDEYMSEMSDKLMELSQDARDRISEIWSDATLTQEEKEARVAEVMKWFNAQRDYIEEQMGHAIDNQAALTDRFYETYQNMQAQVRDTFAETVLSQTTNIAQLSEMTGLLTTGVANLVESGRLASLEYLASMEEINEAAGSTMQDLADNITNATHEIDIASNANVETISELSEVVQEELLNALDSAIEQEERLAASIGATTDAIEAQTAALNNMLRVLNNTTGGNIDINNNPLDTLSQSSEKYGINQPSYNENDWILNHNMTDIFDALYDEEKWNISHEDFLDMYSAIQDWMNILSTQTISAMQGFGSIMSPYYQTPEADELEQNVHIEANFPGVTDSSAIEEAFENLVNKAAQFANRKRQG